MKNLLILCAMGDERDARSTVVAISVNSVASLYALAIIGVAVRGRTVLVALVAAECVPARARVHRSINAWLAQVDSDLCGD